MFNFTDQNKFEDAVLYARVSSEDQQERETIETQVEYSDKYADLHRINITDIYKDDGVSGHAHSLEERPDGKRLIEDAKAGKIKLVLIYNMKRLGRKARFILDAIYQLEQYGVTIRSMTEPFDTSTPMGRFVITLLAGQAEFDRDTLIETLWHGANRHARLGKWLGGIVPYGYRVNYEGFLEVNEDPLPGKGDLSEAGVVRLIFHLIADQKMSTIMVADYLNDLKIPPSYVVHGRKVKKGPERGKRKESTAGIWRPGRVNQIIKNTTYKGFHDYGKRSKREREIIRREVPAIVSEEVWDQAQQVLRDNIIESTRNSTRDYLLRGLIKCGCCGLTYIGTAYPTGSSKKTGKRPLKPTYKCSGKEKYNGSLEKCRSKNIPGEWIENMVWEECVHFIMNPGDAVKELEEGFKVKKSLAFDYKSEIELVRKGIADKETERQSILNLYRQKMITAVDVERQLAEIMKETHSLENRIKELNQLIEDEKDTVHRFESAEALLNEFKIKILAGDPPFHVKRQIVKTLVKEIVITTTFPPDGNDRKKKANIKVRYNFDYAKGNSRTDVRAGTSDPSPRSRYASALRTGSPNTAKKYPARCWTELICMWKCLVP